MSNITSMDHLLASPLGMYQPYLIHTLSIKVSTRFHQLSKTKLGLSGSDPQHLQHNEREKDEHESMNTRLEKRRRRWSTYQLSYE
jgi:hypothetical protein